MPAHNLDHVVLAHLHTVCFQCREQPAHAVTDNSVYPETLGAQPADAIKIVRHALVTYEPVPQYFVAERILDNHQTEVPAPICRVHVDDNVPVLRYDMDMPHAVEHAPYRPYAKRVFLRQLPKSLLAVYVICYYRLLVGPVASNELPAAIQTFI